jgi:hypothetical protein
MIGLTRHQGEGHDCNRTGGLSTALARRLAKEQPTTAILITGSRARASRLGTPAREQHLGIEKDYEAQILDQRVNFFRIENWYSIHSLIRNTLKLSVIFLRNRHKQVSASLWSRTLPVPRPAYQQPRITRSFSISKSFNVLRKALNTFCVVTSDQSS